MAVLGRLSLLLAMLGWSAWLVICNVYEFAPALDGQAFAYGWGVALLALVQSWRARPRAVWGRGLCALAASVGAYLLLIHRGAGQGVAMAVLVAASAVALVATWAMAAKHGRTRPAA